MMLAIEALKTAANVAHGSGIPPDWADDAVGNAMLRLVRFFPYPWDEALVVHQTGRAVKDVRRELGNINHKYVDADVGYEPETLDLPWLERRIMDEFVWPQNMQLVALVREYEKIWRE